MFICLQSSIIEIDQRGAPSNLVLCLVENTGERFFVTFDYLEMRSIRYK